MSKGWKNANMRKQNKKLNLLVAFKNYSITIDLTQRLMPSVESLFIFALVGMIGCQWK